MEPTDATIAATRDAPAFRPPRWPVAAVSIGILWLLWYPFDFTSEASADWLAERSLHKINALVNVLLFAPLGVAIALALRAKPRFLATLITSIIAGAVLSLIGETGQMYLPGRISSAVDVLNNTFGSLVGSVMGWVVSPAILRRWDAVSSWLECRPLARRAAWLFVLLLVARTAPWDFTPETAELKQRVLATIDFAQDQWRWVHTVMSGGDVPMRGALWWAVADAAIFAVTSYAIGRAYRESMEPRGDRDSGAWLVLTVGILTAAGTELLQLPLQSRVADVGDLLGCLAGVCAGAALDATLGRSARDHH